MKPYRKPNIANMISESSVLTKIYGTCYKLAIPCSILHNRNTRFSIGPVEFDVIQYGAAVKPVTPLPASWLVNLNAQGESA